MARDGVGFRLAGDCIGRNRLAILSIVPFVQITVLDQGAGAVQLAGGYAFTGQHPFATRGHLVGDDDFVVRKEFPDKQSWDFSHGVYPFFCLIYILYAFPAVNIFEKARLTHD